MQKIALHPRRGRQAIVNCFGVVFYLLCLLLWLWVCLPFLPFLIEFSQTMQATDTPSARQPSPIVLPPFVAIILGATIVIAALAASLFALITAPRLVAKTSHTALTQVSQKVTAHPKIQQLPEKHRQKLTVRVMIILKVLLCCVPIVIAAASVALPLLIPYSSTVMVAGAISICALVCLGLQLVSAKLLRVPFHTAW